MGRSEKEVLETGGDSKETVPKRGAASVVWRCSGLKKSDIDKTFIYYKYC